VPASAAAALTYLEPVTAALVGWVLFGERLGPAGLVGGALVLAAGVWVALGARAPASPPPLAVEAG